MKPYPVSLDPPLPLFNIFLKGIMSKGRWKGGGVEGAGGGGGGSCSKPTTSLVNASFIFQTYCTPKYYHVLPKHGEELCTAKASYFFFGKKCEHT